MTQQASLFIYGTLRHAPLLEVVAGCSLKISPCRLDDHQAFAVEGRLFPAIAPAAGQSADGLLVSGVGPDVLARLDFYEWAYYRREVTVATTEGPVLSQCYVPDPRIQVGTQPWDFQKWAANFAEATTVAAEEVMALQGLRTPDQISAIYPQIFQRAHSTLRARRFPAPVTLRADRQAADIRVEAQRRPYAGFFSVAEEDLAFPRFDGAMSPRVSRAAFMSGDAVTVLPYDPARDRVLVIEQFRYGPMRRGDRYPWMLEPIAGRIDPGETPEDAARREALEEAGLRIGDLRPIGSYYPSPAVLTEFLFSYIGIADLPDGIGGVAGLESEAEDIRSHVLSFDDLLRLADTGEAGTGPLLLSAMWLAARRDALRPAV